MNSGIKNKAELMLVLLYSGTDLNYEQQKSVEIKGITRLEKLIFLLTKEKEFLKGAERENDFNFFPYKMGPWTNEVYDEVDFLESLGLLTKIDEDKITPADIAYIDELFNNAMLDKYQKNAFISEKGTEVFKLTEEGKQKALIIWNKLSNDEKNNIIEIKRKFNRMNLKQLLRYVYNNFPEYSTKSEIIGALGFKF